MQSRNTRLRLYPSAAACGEQRRYAAPLGRHSEAPAVRAGPGWPATAGGPERTSASLAIGRLALEARAPSRLLWALGAVRGRGGCTATSSCWLGVAPRAHLRPAAPGAPGRALPRAAVEGESSRRRWGGPGPAAGGIASSGGVAPRTRACRRPPLPLVAGRPRVCRRGCPPVRASRTLREGAARRLRPDRLGRTERGPSARTSCCPRPAGTPRCAAPVAASTGSSPGVVPPIGGTLACRLCWWGGLS